MENDQLSRKATRTLPWPSARIIFILSIFGLKNTKTDSLDCQSDIVQNHLADRLIIIVGAHSIDVVTNPKIQIDIIVGCVKRENARQIHYQSKHGRKSISHPKIIISAVPALVAVEGADVGGTPRIDTM